MEAPVSLTGFACTLLGVVAVESWIALTHEHTPSLVCLRCPTPSPVVPHPLSSGVFTSCFPLTSASTLFSAPFPVLCCPLSVVQRCRECARHLSPLLAQLDAWKDSETKLGKLARARLVGLSEMIADHLPRSSAAGGPAPKLQPLARP